MGIPEKAAKETKSAGPLVWIYSRSRCDCSENLSGHMQRLLDEAKIRGYAVVGISQDLCASRKEYRPGLRRMLQAIRDGKVNAVFVQDIGRISNRNSVLMRVVATLQDCGVVLITMDSDMRYELSMRGLEKKILDRSVRRNVPVPWD